MVQEQGAGRPWTIQVVEYISSLRNQSNAPPVGYHWRPSDRSRVDWLHPHIADTALSPASPLSQAHLTTEQISLEDIVALPIADFGVPPRRPDGEAVLRRTRQGVE